MSLDVYLTRRGTITWDDGTTEPHSETLYTANITHNLGTMAEVAGIYKALWRPDEINADTAADIIPLLETGLHLLEVDPERFKQYNSPNGWGLYEHFVPFVKKYLDACKKHPTASIYACR